MDAHESVAPGGEDKLVPGNGDCSVLAFVATLVALIVSLKPGSLKSCLYEKMMGLVYNRETGLLIPQQLRLAAAREAQKRYGADKDHEPGIDNLYNVTEFLYEDGSDLFFNIVAEWFELNVIVWTQQTGVWVPRPFPLESRYSLSVHIRNVPGHYQGIVPHDWLEMTHRNLGSDDYQAWYRKFFQPVDKYIEMKHERTVHYFKDGTVGIEECQQVFNMDLFHQDLTASLNLGLRVRDLPSEPAPVKRPDVVKRKPVPVQKDPEWKGAWVKHLESLKKQPGADKPQLDLYIAAYNKGSAEFKNKKDKEQFEADCEAAAHAWAFKN
jgi:hypothetical protein